LKNASYFIGKQKEFSTISLLHSKALIRKLWQCAQHLRAEASGELLALTKKTLLLINRYYESSKDPIT